MRPLSWTTWAVTRPAACLSGLWQHLSTVRDTIRLSRCRQDEPQIAVHAIRRRQPILAMGQGYCLGKRGSFAARSLSAGHRTTSWWARNWWTAKPSCWLVGTGRQFLFDTGLDASNTRCCRQTRSALHVCGKFDDLWAPSLLVL